MTFEQMRGYWPRQVDDTTGITDYLNGVSKYVVSRTLQDPEWERTTVLRSPDDIPPLKSETGDDIVATGSISLARRLLSAGLIDEYRLFTHPVVLGTRPTSVCGRDRCPSAAPSQEPALNSGIVLLRYRAA